MSEQTRTAEVVRSLAFRSAISAVCDCDGWDGGHDGDCVVWPILHRAEWATALPLGTRVRLMGTTGTVVGPDGMDGTALAVMLDEPYPDGYPEGLCCATARECVPIEQP